MKISKKKFRWDGRLNRIKKIKNGWKKRKKIKTKQRLKKAKRFGKKKGCLKG